MSKSFIVFLKNVRMTYLQRRNIKREMKQYLKYCNSYGIAPDRLTKTERDILILSHTLEKGLSHKAIKPKFGFQVADQLSKAVNEYKNEKSRDTFIFSLGVSALKQYRLANIQSGVPVEELEGIIIPEGAVDDLSAGAYEITGEQLFKQSDSSFPVFIKGRRALRLYDQKSLAIDYDDVVDSVRLAQESPSACNRQAIHVYYTDNADKISRICEVQKGSNGFGENAGGLLVVTSDLRFYTVAEKRLPMFDCGLFSMSLVYALYSKKIGTCILNGSFNRNQDKIVKDLLGINEFEMISTIVLVNKINDDDIVKIACSPRKDVNDVLTRR